MGFRIKGVKTLVIGSYPEHSVFINMMQYEGKVVLYFRIRIVGKSFGWGVHWKKPVYRHKPQFCFRFFMTLWVMLFLFLLWWYLSLKRNHTSHFFKLLGFRIKNQNIVISPNPNSSCMIFCHVRVADSRNGHDWSVGIIILKGLFFVIK